MKKSDLEHLIRAAAAITGTYELMVIGSQSILGMYPDAPVELLHSREADIFCPHHPEMSDLIDGAIGEGSAFDQRFGYYAQGVGPETAILPPGWEQRLVKIQNPNTDLKVGYCLDPHDLAVAKLMAGRDKDWTFVRVLLDHDLIQADVVLDLLHMVSGRAAQQQAAVAWMKRQETTPGRKPVRPR